MKRNAAKTTIVARWHVAESGYVHVPETVVVFSDGRWQCSCAAGKMSLCRHIMKAKGVKNSLTSRLVFVHVSAEGQAQMMRAFSPKEANEQSSGPIRKIDLE